MRLSPTFSDLSVLSFRVSPWLVSAFLLAGCSSALKKDSREVASAPGETSEAMEQAQDDELRAEVRKVDMDCSVGGRVGWRIQVTGMELVKPTGMESVLLYTPNHKKPYASAELVIPRALNNKLNPEKSPVGRGATFETLLELRSGRIPRDPFEFILTRFQTEAGELSFDNSLAIALKGASDSVTNQTIYDLRSGGKLTKKKATLTYVRNAPRVNEEKTIENASCTFTRTE